MRKIISKEEEERVNKRNQWIVGGVLIFLMLFSTLGYAFQSITTDPSQAINGTQQKVEYNGFDFIEQNGFWILDKDGISFIFRNNPYEVQKIESEVKPLIDYEAKDLYIYSESVESESEIRTNLRQFVNKIESACLEGEDCGNNTKIKNCSDNFIIIKESNELERIEQLENCVFIEGQRSSLSGLTDEFLFKIIGVED